MEDLKREVARLGELLTQQTEVMARQLERIADLERRVGSSADQVETSGTSTRRQLFAGAVATIAGVASLAAASSADAKDGDPLILGTQNEAKHGTELTYKGPADLPNYGIRVTDSAGFPGASAAIIGHTSGKFDIGVHGSHSGTGINNAGVAGYAVRGTGVAGQSIYATGVVGYGQRGVHGNGGTGKRSIGLLATVDDPNGTALVVHGIMRMYRTGRATVPAGQKRTTIYLNHLTDTSLVFATSQKLAGGVAVEAAQVKTAAGEITIWLNAAAPAGGLPVAWVVFDMLGEVFP